MPDIRMVLAKAEKLMVYFIWCATYAKATPSAQLSIQSKRDAHTVPCCNTNGAKVVIDKRLDGERLRFENFRWDELGWLVWLSHANSRTTECASIINTPGPYLRFFIVSYFQKANRGQLTIPRSSTANVCIPPAQTNSTPAPSFSPSTVPSDMLSNHACCRGRVISPITVVPSPCWPISPFPNTKS